MPAASQIIMRVSSNEMRQCPLCRQTDLDGIKNFEAACNHLLQTHKLKCLHIGQETTEDRDGKPWQSTVAVFGK